MTRIMNGQCTTYRLRMPWPRPPISANDRRHRMEDATEVAQIRHDVGWIVKAARMPPSDHVTVGLEYVPATRRCRDGGENLCPTLKACIDGVVDAGVVPDDAPEYVKRTMPEVAPVDRANSGVFLLLELSDT
jgi:crossover junction endodeoxyribonuclease RusA